MDSISSINNICTVSNIFPVDGHPNIVNNDNICLVDGILGKVISEENQSDYNVNDNICPMDGSSSINNICTVDNLFLVEGNPNKVNNDNICLVDGISDINILNAEDICQLDGNASVDNSLMFSSDYQSNNCQVNGSDDNSHEASLNNESINIVPSHWGYRPILTPPNEGRPITARHAIRRDEGLVVALSLPNISLYNMRSIWAKAGNLADDILARQVDICFLTEVWQKLESKKHNYKIEEMLEMKGIHYISTPRPGSRRGGGVAMAFPASRFLVTKLNIHIPKPLECMFALVKPIETGGGKLKKIIAVCFYSPPKSKKNSQLIDLITGEISPLRTQHNGCGVIICGDRNDLHI